MNYNPPRSLINRLLLLCAILLSMLNANSQDDHISPQLWNNLFVGWNVSEKIIVQTTLAYNVLLSTENPWQEITTSLTAGYQFHRFMSASAGFYFARTKQTGDLKSFEYRPYAGFRVFTNTQKRWIVTNLTRGELRIFDASDQTTSLAWRFRNRTSAIVSLNQPKLVNDRNLFLFGYFEAFLNLGDEVKERFFNQFKYKFGVGYRHNYNWRIDVGLIYQDAKDNVSVASQLPTNEITNFIFEYTISYVIPVKRKD